MSIKNYPQFYEEFGDGKKYKKIELNSLEKHKESLPENIFNVLKEDGISSYMNGFLWTLDPSEYIEWLNNWIQLETVCTPFARTALGDVLFMKEKYISILYSNKGLMDYLMEEDNWFFDMYLSDEEYVDKYLNQTLWKKLGDQRNTLNYDQCFGLEPILSLGGSEKVENLKKVQLKEYLFLLSQAEDEVNFVKY